MTKVGAGISIANIMATSIKGGSKSTKGGGGASGGGTVSATTKLSDFQQSSFNSVDNDIAQRRGQAMINSQEQSSTPTRAYVTARDVFSSNALERNRVGEAGF